MASGIDLTVSGQENLAITSGAVIDYKADYTVIGFFKSNNTTGNRLSSLFYIEGNGAGNDPYDRLEIRVHSSAGSTMQVQLRAEDNTGAPADETAYDLTTSHVHAFALTRDGNDLNATVWSLNDGTTVTASVTLTDATDRYDSDEMRLGVNLRGGPTYAEAEVKSYKAWSRLLTAAEIQTEIQRESPLVWDSLFGWWPMDGPDATRRPLDFSGNGNDWTENNSPAFADFVPPVAWGGEDEQIDEPAADGGGAMTTASATAVTAPWLVHFDTIDTVSPSWTSGVEQSSSDDVAELRYEWTFDDAGNEEDWRYPTQSPGSNNEHQGFLAAHVFESAGTHTVTLTLTETDGTETVYTEDIEVSAFAGTTYYVSNAGSNGNDGLSTGAPFETFAYAMTFLADDVRILFNRGDTWTVSANISVDADPWIIGAYGTGNRPIFNHTAGGNLWTLRGAGGWRLVDLDLRVTSGGGNSPFYFHNPGADDADDFLMLRCRVDGWESTQQNERNTNELIGIVDCDIVNGGTYGSFFAGASRIVYMGNSVDNTGGSSHVLRIGRGYKAVISRNRLFDPGSGRHALKLHGPIFGGSRPDTQYVHISDNEVRGDDWCIAIAPTDASSDERILDVVVERNRIYGMADSNREMAVAASSVIVRNNVFFAENVTGSTWRAVSIFQRGGEPSPPDDIRVLHNTVYCPETLTATFSIYTEEDSPTNVEADNNLISAPDVTTVVSTGGLEVAASSFVDTVLEDFRLVSASPAIDNETRNVSTLYDYEGTDRTDPTNNGAYDGDAGTYTLTCEGGSFAMTGSSINLIYPAGSSAATLAGNRIGLNIGLGL